MLQGSAEQLAAALLALAPTTGRLVLVIDGGSGSGKTSLARACVAQHRRRLQLVSLDDYYPGWHGLAEASAQVPALIRSAAPHYQRWDWVRSTPGVCVDLNPDDDLLIEGCGALTPASAELATMTIWCQLDPTTRHQRAISRDGDDVAQWWQLWATQERRHWAQHRPRDLADHIVEVGVV